MNEILEREGFTPSENQNEYIKGDWTIRIDDDLLEIFNNPDKAPGVYYCGPLNKIDLQTILDELANFDYNL